MNNCQSEDFLGNWLVNGKCESDVTYQGNLKIEKTGETYNCQWKISKDNVEYELLGIGIFVDNQLLISRFPIRSLGGGIGLYKPIGDYRSNAALWAATRNFDTLGSGIAIREDASEAFEGCYKVRYFIKGNEIPVYDLKITRREKNDLYSLSWSIEDKVMLHAIGMKNNGQMVLAYGGIDTDYEVVILSVDNESKETILKGKSALLSNNKISEELLTRY